MKQGEWLVEIRLKDWKADLSSGGRIVSFEEVVAPDDYTARVAGFDQFEKRLKYEPIARRRFKKHGLSLADCCAPDAVQIS